MAYASNHEPTFLGLKLWQQVVLGLVFGILCGLAIRTYGGTPEQINELAVKIKTLGDIFIKLIKMIVAPLIMFALISGITSLSGTGSASRIGLKGAAAYMLTAILAVIFGLTIASIAGPGVGIDPELTEKYLKAGSIRLLPVTSLLPSARSWLILFLLTFSTL
jgi:Na+/H+-dicarboxylate symporter